MDVQAKPILRVGKIKKTGVSTFQSVASHLNRSRPTPNSDPARTKLNKTLLGDPSRPLEDLALTVYRKCGIDPKSLRKDATLANDIVMSISPKWFRPDDPDAAGTWDKNRLQAFEAEALQFLKKGFGNRLIRVDLHLDEATPHIHAIVVPVLPSSDKSHFRLSGKDMFNPQRLTAMQEAWEKRMSKHGVGPRLKGSRASHTKLKDYYAAVDSMEVEERLKSASSIKSDPPKKGIFEKAADHQARVDDWKKAHEKATRDELRPLAHQAAKGRLYDAERLTAEAARSDASQSRSQFATIAERYQELADQLDLSKAEIAQLRGANIRDVAQRLEYDGPISPKANAIDLVKTVNGWNFQQAVAWLHEQFGADTAATAFAQGIEQNPVPAPLTAADKIKAREIERQLSAMDAEGYRVTIFKDNRGWNFGKSDKSLNKDLLTKEEVLANVAKLAKLNASGGNVYVTPVDMGNHFVLIDDLTATGRSRMRERGYSPAVTLETSPGSLQAVLRVPRASSPTEAVNEFFKDLNRDLGDAKIVGLSHPFRLAGFTNRKEKHERQGRFPFVRILDAVNVTCHRSMQVIKAYASQKLGLDYKPPTP